MSCRSIDVSQLGIRYKGTLVRTFLICATIYMESKRKWKQGPTRVFINGKRVTLMKGQEVAQKVYGTIKRKR